MDLSVEQRLEMGRKGRQRVIDKFDLDKQVKQVEDVYRKLSIQVSSIEPSQSH
jgi:glycosyltransferase involved in cell wall biosynthesis